MKNARILISAVLSAMILTGACTGALAAEEGLSEQVTLYVATDLHYLSPELTDHGDFFQRMIRNGDGKAMEYCEEVTDALVEQVIAQQPDALILTGDLTFNGARLSHTALAEKLRQIEDGGVPVLVIPGNHDLKNRLAASFQGEGYELVDSVNAREFAEIYKDFGLGEAIARDDASLSYVAEVTRSLWVLMLDVNAFGAGSIDAETLRWVEQQLQAAQEQGVHMIAASHQNLLVHNDMFVYGYVIGNRFKLQALYDDYGVLCNLSGHIHMQHTTRSASGLPEMVTSSLMVWPNQYGVLTLEGKSAEYHTASVAADQPELADATHAFFWDNAYGQAMSSLGEEADEALGRFFADANTAYFAGRLDQLPWDEEQVAAWQTSGARFASYFETIADDRLDHTVLTFDFD